MEVEEALKMIMSLGVVVPSWGKKDLDDLPESVNRKLRNDDNQTDG